MHGSHWNPLSWALMGAGAALDWAVNHAFGILSGGALLIGMACQLFDTYLRWRNSEASRAKLRAEAHAAGKAEGRSETLQGLGIGPEGELFPDRN